MGPHYTLESHNASFTARNQLTSIFTVTNYEQAKEKILYCQKERYGCIELCGAFGEDKTKELIHLTENQIALGYVTHYTEQDALFIDLIAIFYAVLAYQKLGFVKIDGERFVNGIRFIPMKYQL